ncbi:hypothetical protein C808_02867 [Lachnospiraceae bacterium M18-1]|nr:hypothetical protein C808_02867 [Lachnospiraceae bacterium M18-1]
MFSLQKEHIIGMLSKGMKMKYALALALSHNAELLIMDVNWTMVFDCI